MNYTPPRHKPVRRAHKNKFPRRTLVLILGAMVVILGVVLIGIKAMGSHASVPQAAAVPVAAPTKPIPDAYAKVSLIGKAAIVYDVSTGQTLYAQNAYSQLPLASVTKLLTLYAASSVLSPDTPVTMTPVALSQDGDAADFGFTEGESFRFEDLARLTLAASSNDGAEAIVEAADTAKSTQTSVLLANAATSAGLHQTYAVNGTGLDESTVQSGGYGSAHDMAMLAGELLKKAPTIAAATTQPTVTVTSLDGTRHTFANTDPDVGKFPSLLLSKTGYTDLAGGNLVIVYDEGINHPVAIVVLGSTQDGRFTDVQNLMKATLAHFAGTTPN